MSARFQVVQAVWRQQRATGKRLGMRGPGPLHGGAVCFWQYFGSSLQLTPHLHLAGARSAVDGLGRGGDVAAARRRSGSTRSREATRCRRCAGPPPPSTRSFSLAVHSFSPGFIVFAIVDLHFHSTDFEMPVSSANALTLIPGGVNSRFTICSLMLSE